MLPTIFALSLTPIYLSSILISALHPGRCARVLLQGQPIGFLGE